MECVEFLALRVSLGVDQLKVLVTALRLSKNHWTRPLLEGLDPAFRRGLALNQTFTERVGSLILRTRSPPTSLVLTPSSSPGFHRSTTCTVAPLGLPWQPIVAFPLLFGLATPPEGLARRGGRTRN